MSTASKPKDQAVLSPSWLLQACQLCAGKCSFYSAFAAAASGKGESQSLLGH